MELLSEDGVSLNRFIRNRRRLAVTEAVDFAGAGGNDQPAIADQGVDRSAVDLGSEGDGGFSAGFLDRDDLTRDTGDDFVSGSDQDFVRSLQFPDDRKLQLAHDVIGIQVEFPLGIAHVPGNDAVELRVVDVGFAPLDEIARTGSSRMELYRTLPLSTGSV